MKLLAFLLLLLREFHALQGASRFSTCRSALISHRNQRNARKTCCSATSKDQDSASIMSVLEHCSVTNPATEQTCSVMDGILPLGRASEKQASRKLLLVICPQLGDFDTFEYCELLTECLSDLRDANIQLRVIGIGNADSARRFSEFTGMPLDYIRVDSTASLHQALNLHQGPNWNVPSFIPTPMLQWFRDSIVGASKESDEWLVARAWLNYMAMCAGIAAPDTLSEIFRGYLGDKTAPERLRPDEVVRVGSNDEIVITGTTHVKLGPIEYDSLWSGEKGYQRPAELATVRLRGMVEALENFSTCVPDQTHLAWRGATFFLQDDGVLYEHRDTGVLAYSRTMARPLSFLLPYIGKKALNPLGLADAHVDM